jgi:hypothetical protein
MLIKLSATSTMTSKHACALIRGKKLLATGINYSVPTMNIVNSAIRRHPCRRTGQHWELRSKIRRKKGLRFKTPYPTCLV